MILISDVDSDSEELNKANVEFAISRLRFFVVVFEFNSIETCDTVYDSLDGTNLGDSGLRLDLCYVADDKTFEVPDRYIYLVQTLRPNSTKFKNIAFQSSASLTRFGSLKSVSSLSSSTLDFSFL